MASGQWVSYIGYRLLQSIPLLVGVIVVNFVVLHLAPGDPVSVMVGPSPVSQEYVTRLRHGLGLDRPLIEQLIRYLVQVAQGHLGESYVYRQSVVDVIVSRLPPTLLLMGTAYVFSSLLGIVVGMISAREAGSPMDGVLMTFALVGNSVPTFWTGYLALLLFSLSLGWFPVSGMVDVRISSSGIGHWIDITHHLVLPAAVLTLFFMALVARLMRASMLNVLQSDFITVVRARGANEIRVILRHALPNAVLPVITIMGLQFGNLLSGAVLTETVFGWPGLGRLLVDGAQQRDYPLLLGMFVFTTALIIIANIATDLAYTLINPRVRLD